MNKYNPGIYEIENEDYHNSEGLSRSALLTFKKSPLHYWNQYKKNDYQGERDSAALILGNAVHTYILQHEQFNDKYFIIDKPDLRTTKGKEEWAKIQLLNNDKIILPTSIFEEVKKIGDSFHQHPLANKFLENAQIEKSIFWKDCKTNVLCKTRPDIWLPNIIADIKTTMDASPRAFQRDIMKYGYHIQAAMVQDGIYHLTHKMIETFVFIAIEKDDPYAIGIYELDKDSIQKGREEYKALLEDYRPYEENDMQIWPGYKPTVISLPAYY
jgi:hypothetical protein